jgi:hypothetical protein
VKTFLVALLASLFALAAHAAEFTNASQCVPGKRVVHRDGKAGAVVAVSNGLCVVQQDDGSQRNSLHWMLSPAGNAAAAGGAAPDKAAGGGLPPGAYTCSAYGAGTFPITISAGGRYSDRAGKSGQYRMGAGKEIAFTSGSLASYHSEQLGPTKFGLALAKGKRFSTVCNRKK